MLSKEKKTNLIDEFKKHENDTGSEEVQVALLTEDIKALTEHAQKNKHDYSSKRGLLKKVNRRRKLLDYIKRNSESAYQEIIKRLGLRK
jgi:small subunit ribosomal protein S15